MKGIHYWGKQNVNKDLPIGDCTLSKTHTVAGATYFPMSINYHAIYKHIREKAGQDKNDQCYSDMVVVAAT